MMHTPVSSLIIMMRRLIINASDINLESNEADYESLISMIMSNPKGKNFVNPQPSII